MSLSRRGFLQLLGAGSLGVVLPGTVAAAERGEVLATMLDLSKCIGCGACSAACQESNAHKQPDPEKPFPKMFPDRVPVADWSEKRGVNDRLTPYNWLYIQKATVQVDGADKTINIPRRCLHCENPPCANICPWGSCTQQDNGIVRIQEETCMGGAKCKKVCPWGIPERQTGVGLYLDVLPSLAGNGVMYKCDRCYDKVAKGELPACISACPVGVQTIGPREEILKLARARAAELGGEIYGEKENGGTNTFYVSPVPFAELNKAIETGPGRPHLAPVGDSMATERLLTAPLLAAPVIGALATLVFNRDEQQDEDASGAEEVSHD